MQGQRILRTSWPPIAAPICLIEKGSGLFLSETAIFGADGDAAPC
jgi:hypothetical protein